jgi:hypothetical protein
MPAPFEATWLDEALSTLDQHNVRPVVDGFLKKFGLSLSGPKAAKLMRIHNAIAAPVKRPSFEDLVDYVDNLKMYGKQHVFPHELKEGHEDYLEELRDPRNVAKRLPQSDSEEPTRDPDVLWYKLVWKAPKPELAEVRHSFAGGQGELSLKWVATRDFAVPVKVQVPGGPPVPRFVLQQERSVNFFIVNLGDGTAEIRIQTLQPFPARDLKAELGTYRAEADSIVRLDCFTPVPVAPTIVTCLRKPILPITTWEVAYPDGRKLGGLYDPSFLFKFGLPFKNAHGRELTVYWECKQEVTGARRLFFSLDGDDNRVLFNAVTDRSRVDFILGEVRKLSRRIPPDGEETRRAGIRGGLLGYMRRAAETSEHERILKPAVVPILVSSFGSLVVEAVVSYGKQTLCEELWNAILPAVPFKAVQFAVLAAAALVFFGSNTVTLLGRIPREFLVTALRLFLLSESRRSERLNKKYRPVSDQVSEWHDAHPRLSAPSAREGAWAS